jgi:outer membrane lipoprotein carrier protein
MKFAPLACLALAALTTEAASVQEGSASARGLVRAIEEHNARTADLVARFTQSYRSGVLGREIVERGIVRVKRPGRMRWEYQEPESKLFVSDGRTFYFYVPADRQVVVSEQDPRHSLAARLLSGASGLLEEFQASLEEPLEPGVMRLRLVPRQPEADVESATVDAEPGGRIRGVLLHDLQGNRTRFRFEDVRENSGLADRLFRFEIPKGVEVIRG